MYGVGAANAPRGARLDRQTDGPLLDVQMLFGVAGARDSVHGQK